MKKLKTTAAILLCALAFSVLAGLTLGDSGRQEYYAGLLREGIITEAEFAKLERFHFELPESEKTPLDDFMIGEITQGSDGSVVSQ